MRFVLIALTLATLAVGCRCEPQLRPTTGGLEVTPRELQFPPLYVGARATALVTLTNTGPAGLDVSLSTQAPFSSPPELRLGGGESATVEVEFAASVAGEAEGLLVVTADAKETEVSLRASALSPLACPLAECRSSVFDPQAGACVTTPLVDGAVCNPGCGASGLCVAGVCRAQSAGLCDDADPCTVDACGADGRCVALPLTCPVSNSCQLASCRPGVGCVEEPVEDGVACGDRLCASALICLGGSCVRAATPDGDRQCTYVDVSAHRDSSCVKNAAGAVRCWGDNSRDQLLRGAPSVSEAPGAWPIGVPVDSFTGQNILCAISSGRVSCPDNRPVQEDAGDDLWAEYFPQGGCGGGGGPSGVLADGGLRACLSHPALAGVEVTRLRT